jgi:4-alpha-glucanotransferase/alpha-amylase
MPCCDGYSGRFIHQGEILGGFGQLLALDDTRGITLDDRHMNGSVRLSSSAPVRLSAQPYHTVSQSEDGLEKIMQSVSMRLSWAVIGKAEMTLTLEARPGEAMTLREAAD